MAADDPQLLADDDWPSLLAAWTELGVASSAHGEPFGSDAAVRNRANPAGRGVVAVVRVEDRYLALASYTPKTLCVGGAEVPVAEIGATYTAPAAQGRGYFSKLVRFLVAHAAEAGIAGLYGTPNEASGRVYIGRLKWRPVWPWIRWLRPAVPLVGSVLDAASSLGRGEDGAHYSLTHAATIADSFDPYRVRDPHLKRTAPFLAWRYPQDDYAYVRAATESGRTTSWLVAGRTTRLGRPAMAIADMSFDIGHERDLIGLVRLARTRFPGTQLVFSMSSPEGRVAELFRRYRAVGRPSVMPLIAHAAADPAGARLFDEMSFIAGDSDTV